MTLEERREYIYNAMLDMIKADSDLAVEICEELDGWNNFLGDDRCHDMCDIDEILGDRKPSDILNMVTSDFDYNDDYFYFSVYGLESCDDKADHYLDSFSDEDILDSYLDNACHCNLSNSDFEELTELWESYSDDDTEEETDEEFMERIDELS